MTRESIEQALRRGQRVTLQGEPWMVVCRDMFGDLTVQTILHEADDVPPVPVRMATEDDLRRAAVVETEK